MATNSTNSVAILAMQARSLLVMLEELTEDDEGRAGHSDEPHSCRQKRMACLRSLGMHIDALESAAGSAAATEGPAQFAVETERRSKERGYLTRQAMGNLLMASLEMHTMSGRSDAAFVLTEKALHAIGALRVMTNGGRVQP